MTPPKRGVLGLACPERSRRIGLLGFLGILIMLPRPSTLSAAFLASFLAWTFLCERFGLRTASVAAIVMIAGSTIVMVRHPHRLMRQIATVVATMIISIAVSSVAMINGSHWTNDGSIENFADGRTATITGIIAEAPDERPTETRYIVEAKTITTICKKSRKEPSPGCGQGPFDPPAVHGRVLATGFTWPPLKIGDAVRITGKLTTPGVIDDFDEGRYLSLSDVYATMGRASIDADHAGSVDRSMKTRLLRTLFTIRSWFDGRVGQIFPEPHASLLLGLTTGERSGLPQTLPDAFRRAGLSHIVAVSGYNVTIVLLILSGLLCWLPLKIRTPILGLAIVGFGLFTGASPPVVRAVIMGLLGLMAIMLGRQTTPRLTILWTAFFMVLYRPQAIAFDVSFQLSFLAVIGLMEVSPWLLKVFRKVPDTLGIRTSLAATIAAQIATIPLTIFTFHQISLIAPITNLLVAPLIPIAMFLGFIAAIAGALWMPLGLALGYPAWAVLELIIRIAVIGAGVPGAAVRW